MASSQEVNAGLHKGWTQSESGWGEKMTENLIVIGATLRLAVNDKDLTTPAGGEAEGDRFIVAATASGSWVGKEKKVAIKKGAGWLFVTPSEGWECWVKDEDRFYIYDGSAWQPSHGLALGTWTTPTGTATRSGFVTSTATAQDCAEAIMALVQDLKSQKIL